VEKVGMIDRIRGRNHGVLGFAPQDQSNSDYMSGWREGNDEFEDRRGVNEVSCPHCGSENVLETFVYIKCYACGKINRKGSAE
jgi:hypothetical protein